MWQDFTKLASLLAISTLMGCSSLQDMVTTSTAGDELQVSPAAQREYQQVLDRLDADDPQSAMKSLEKFIARYPDYPGAYTTLAIIYSDQDRVAEAMEALSIALSVDADFAPAHNQIGVIKRRDGDFESAKQAWQAAIAADSEYAYAWHNLGVLYDLYLADLPAALQHYQRYQVLAADDAQQTERWIADLRRRIGKQPRAARLEEQLL